jgi:tetratricopeptide (TPR) repeat protein
MPITAQLRIRHGQGQKKRLLTSRSRTSSEAPSFNYVGSSQQDRCWHCEPENLRKAIDYWLKAARMALDRSAGSEAHAQVEKGIALLPKIEDSLVRQQFEGRLQVALGDTLVMTKGFASPDVAATLTRARDLLDESIYPIEALCALCGLFNYHLMRSEAPKGLKLAEAFLKRPLDQLTSPVIEYLVGAAHLHIGNFKDARFRLENSLALYEEDACRPIAFIGGYHIRSFTLVWLGLAYLYSGSFDRARKTMSDAVEDARTRSHPFTLVSALLALARFLNHTRDFKRAVEATEEGFVIATDQRSPYHISRASVLRAVNLIAANQHKEGIALMEHALVAHRETGANYQSSYNLSNLAFAHAQVGNIELALEIASQAVVEVEQSGERWWEAEARRIRGEILLAAAPIHRDEAEACFQRGLECARRQEARFWELRAAQSLAKSWHARRRHAEAQQLLAPIHGAFSDGFDFPDLQDAKELLVRLDSPANCRITLSSN